MRIMKHEILKVSVSIYSYTHFSLPYLIHNYVPTTFYSMHNVAFILGKREPDPPARPAAGRNPKRAWKSRKPGNKQTWETLT